jgi:hypothetical protein
MHALACKAATKRRLGTEMINTYNDDCKCVELKPFYGWMRGWEYVRVMGALPFAFFRTPTVIECVLSTPAHIAV